MELAHNRTDFCSVDTDCYDILPLQIRYYHHINEHLVGVISILANGVLMALLLTETNRVLRAYSQVLLQNCVLDAVYTIALIVTEYQMELVDGLMVVVYSGVLRVIPASRHRFICLFDTTLNAASILVMPIVFIFRYMLVVRNYMIRPWQLIWILCVSLLMSLWLAFMLMLSMSETEEAERAANCANLLRHPIWHQPGDAEITKCVHSRADNPFLIAFFVGVSVAGVVSYVIMSYCTLAVIRAMRERRNTENISDRTVKMQQQMNVMLITQMTFPLFTSIIPLMIIAVSPLLHINIPGLGVAVSMALAWVPLISPCTTILLVANFRRRIARFTLSLFGTCRPAGNDDVSVAPLKSAETVSQQVSELEIA